MLSAELHLSPRDDLSTCRKKFHELYHIFEKKCEMIDALEKENSRMKKLLELKSFSKPPVSKSSSEPNEYEYKNEIRKVARYHRHRSNDHLPHSNKVRKSSYQLSLIRSKTPPHTEHLINDDIMKVFDKVVPQRRYSRSSSSTSSTISDNPMDPLECNVSDCVDNEFYLSDNTNTKTTAAENSKSLFMSLSSASGLHTDHHEISQPQPKQQKRLFEQVVGGISVPNLAVVGPSLESSDSHDEGCHATFETAVKRETSDFDTSINSQQSSIASDAMCNSVGPQEPVTDALKRLPAKLRVLMETYLVHLERDPISSAIELAKKIRTARLKYTEKNRSLHHQTQSSSVASSVLKAVKKIRRLNFGTAEKALVVSVLSACVLEVVLRLELLRIDEGSDMDPSLPEEKRQLQSAFVEPLSRLSLGLMHPSLSRSDIEFLCGQTKKHIKLAVTERQFRVHHLLQFCLSRYGCNEEPKNLSSPSVTNELLSWLIEEFGDAPVTEPVQSYEFDSVTEAKALCSITVKTPRDISPNISGCASDTDSVASSSSIMSINDRSGKYNINGSVIHLPRCRHAYNSTKKIKVNTNLQLSAPASKVFLNKLSGISGVAMREHNEDITKKRTFDNINEDKFAREKNLCLKTLQCVMKNKSSAADDNKADKNEQGKTGAFTDDLSLLVSPTKVSPMPSVIFDTPVDKFKTKSHSRRAITSSCLTDFDMTP